MTNYPKKSLKQLEALADKWFSYFIRLRDADEFGFVKCCTCNKRLFWKDVDCGHWIKRGHDSTRYDEKNCSAQCRFPCNRRNNGEHEAHRMFIEKKYGEETAAVLKYKSSYIQRFRKEEYIEIIERYKKIVQSNPLFNGQ